MTREVQYSYNSYDVLVVDLGLSFVLFCLQRCLYDVAGLSSVQAPGIVLFTGTFSNTVSS